MARLVEGPHALNFRPNQCCVTQRADGEFIDFEAEIAGIDPHVYIRRSVIEDVGRELLGMVPASEVEELRERLDNAQTELARLQRIETATNELEAALEAAETPKEPQPA